MKIVALTIEMFGVIIYFCLLNKKWILATLTYLNTQVSFSVNAIVKTQMKLEMPACKGNKNYVSNIL